MVAASIVFIALWFFYLAYMLIAKKDKEKIKDIFSMGIFFTAIWALIYLIIL
jgi:hypothetical protein